MTAVPPPSPDTAADAAAFTAGLRRLKAWSGLSFRELERRASAAGDVLPYSTASTALGKDRLPRAEVVTAFVRACGIADEDVRLWAAARTRIATGELPSAPRPRTRRLRGRVAVCVAAALAAVTLSLGAAWATGLGDSTREVDRTVVDGG